MRRRASVVRALAIAGAAGPVLFTSAFVLQALLRPGYSHLASPVSALAAGPTGWVQDANFFGFGCLTVACAIGLHLGVRPTRRGAAGPLLLGLSGVGLVLVGVAFPARDAAGAFSVGPGHLAGAYLSFLGAAAGLIVLSRRMAADPRWRSLAGYALVSGIAVAALFVATGALAGRPGMPLHAWLGLLQRVTLAVWLPAVLVLEEVWFIGS